MSASWNLLGKAMQDYYSGDTKAVLFEHSFWGRRETPLSYYFRDEEDMPPAELHALDLCQGRVLESGAGSGCHSLVLQDRGLDIFPIDIDPLAVKVMQQRGLSMSRCIDFFNLKNEQYDSILMLMNGIGFIGTQHRLPAFFNQCRHLLKRDGILIFDSSDIREERKEEADYLSGKYPGEVSFHFEYKEQSALPFKWLFLDPDKLRKAAQKADWIMQIEYQNQEGDYLALLQPASWK